MTQPYQPGEFFRTWIEAQRRKLDRPTPAKFAYGLTLLSWRERGRLRFLRHLYQRGVLNESVE